MAEPTIPPDGPENIVLRYLRAISEELAKQRETMNELVVRFGRFERELGSMKMEIANLHGDYAMLSNRLDRVETRLQRIERRLDLIEEPATTPPGDSK